ncbi:helix-turn-helix transcriptional regulator [Zunongwangia sp. F260]|uniref:Helix-turn-helix transcriptional regulator n=1 Tax=Autumnicola lenta TaxID=3075593 RepID=A0ABU3CK55_9FLAO|nr:helix-turn-helix transcriptional regulator [Zunongwangia sp. F260]MDT0646330.1 helix-turn-helix transcriptional regulator [Zunongwangia sp. F260]
MEYLRIKELLKEKGMTGKELAEKTNVSNVTISNIASGNSFPKPQILQSIAEALGVRLKDLFAAEEGMRPIFIKEGDKYIKIGEIDKTHLNEG